MILPTNNPLIKKDHNKYKSSNNNSEREKKENLWFYRYYSSRRGRRLGLDLVDLMGSHKWRS